MKKNIKKYELRSYQKAQLNFIETHIDSSNIIGISSPTGSGKTVTFLTFIKEWLNKPENQLSNVIISTGFNNLVFLLDERCKEMGLNSKILIGTKACNCPALMDGIDDLEDMVFTQTTKYRCGDKHKHLDLSTKNWNEKVCPFTQQLYRTYYDKIMSNVGQVIITNHSSLLVHQEHLQNVSLIVIDEAHTFDTFYESYLRLELDKNDLSQIDQSINTLESPMDMIIKRNMEKELQLPQKQIEAICENIESVYVSNKAKEFFETKPDYSNYIERNKDSFTIDRFYRSIELKIPAKIILFSATLDEFTLNIFNVNKINVYHEYKTFCDYSQSEFIAIPDEDFNHALKNFLEYVNNKNLKSGLILSTTITDVNNALSMNGLYDYKMFTSLDKFNEYRKRNSELKAILVGSRALFQGIDIQNLDFVCLNKIPFPVYNDKLKAQQNYLTNNGKNDFDPWKEFIVPKTENDIIQSLGRLWRSTDSKGVVSIFDPRIEGRFKYMMRDVFNVHRHGIQSYIMKENGKIEDFKLTDNRV